ncbi:probable G-protein coupled receptor 139 [Callorhinchus milii]|uniref:probable G-protein coupled receptor 139 n=1 Tax=Callorhinchus milii TaxID=7868 RepID=UPI001C3F6903|nr:probable G-protein coupled receptor 139 [Callorhinchus milii]
MLRALAYVPWQFLPTLFRIMIVYYPILAAIGITGNLLAIVVLSRGKCGLSKGITFYLVAMAVADILFAINDVVLNAIHSLYFDYTFLDITPVCSLRLVLKSAVTHMSVWFTVAFTFDRLVAICCELKASYCSERTAAVVVGVISSLSCFISIPWYFMYEPSEILNNVPWYCQYKEAYYTSATWIVYHWFDTIITPFVPFFLILLMNVVTVRHILAANRIRRNLLHQKSNSGNDAEMENRRKSIILLFAISGSFIVLWLMYVLDFILSRTLDKYFYQSYRDPVYVVQHVTDMLKVLSCCTNTVIYALTQSKFRKDVKYLVIYPFKHIFKLFK